MDISHKTVDGKLEKSFINFINFHKYHPNWKPKDNGGNEIIIILIIYKMLEIIK